MLDRQRRYSIRHCFAPGTDDPRPLLNVTRATITRISTKVRVLVWDFGAKRAGAFLQVEKGADPQNYRGCKVNATKTASDSGKHTQTWPVVHMETRDALI